MWYRWQKNRNGSYFKIAHLAEEHSDKWFCRRCGLLLNSINIGHNWFDQLIGEELKKKIAAKTIKNRWERKKNMNNTRTYLNAHINTEQKSPWMCCLNRGIQSDPNLKCLSLFERYVKLCQINGCWCHIGSGLKPLKMVANWCVSLTRVAHKTMPSSNRSTGRRSSVWGVKKFHQKHQHQHQTLALSLSLTLVFHS